MIGLQKQLRVRQYLHGEVGDIELRLLSVSIRWFSPADCPIQKTQSITSLPSVTLTAQGLFC